MPTGKENNNKSIISYSVCAFYQAHAFTRRLHSFHPLIEYILSPVIMMMEIVTVSMPVIMTMSMRVSVVPASMR